MALSTFVILYLMIGVYFVMQALSDPGTVESMRKSHDESELSYPVALAVGFIVVCIAVVIWLPAMFIFGKKETE